MALQSFSFTACIAPLWFARFRTSAVAPSELWRDKRFSVAASLFYFALLHKKVGLANPKACQAEVFSPKKRRLELTSHQLGKFAPGNRFFRFSYVQPKQIWNQIIIYWIEAFYKIHLTIQEPVTSLVRGQAK
ncbi:MAG: hypothetical protein IJA35_04740 [Clostridia bacterium]|nr:hypothetical protein [Clostridia bacterium]MBQ7022935.1 hypothetical protein [Akkermansia sp.]